MNEATASLKESVGRYGVWSVQLRAEDPEGAAERAEAAAELERLGYGACGSAATAPPGTPPR